MKEANIMPLCKQEQEQELRDVYNQTSTSNGQWPQNCTSPNIKQ